MLFTSPYYVQLMDEVTVTCVYATGICLVGQTRCFAVLVVWTDVCLVVIVGVSKAVCSAMLPLLAALIEPTIKKALKTSRE